MYGRVTAGVSHTTSFSFYRLPSDVSEEASMFTLATSLRKFVGGFRQSKCLAGTSAWSNNSVCGDATDQSRGRKMAEGQRRTVRHYEKSKLLVLLGCWDLMDVNPRHQWVFGL